MNQKKVERYEEKLVIDGKEVAIIEVVALDEPYFQLSLKFPNGSKRTLYISYNALEMINKAKAAGS